MSALELRDRLGAATLFVSARSHNRGVAQDRQARGTMHHIRILLFAASIVLSVPTPGQAWIEDGASSAHDTPASSAVSTLGSCHVACEHDQAPEADAELEQARAYLLETAKPGGTMVRQGPGLAIERLHPEFTKRLAAAIREARVAGLADAGIFSAYRPPAFGVGGFADKFYSLHAYGLAVDMFGIGNAGSAEAKVWHETAARHGIVCPYGYRNRVEWNHCQPTKLEAVKSNNPLRVTITGAGPVDLKQMFEVGNRLIADVQTALRSVIENRPVPVIYTASNARLSVARRTPRRSARLRTTKPRTFASRQINASRAGVKGRARSVKSMPTRSVKSAQARSVKSTSTRSVKSTSSRTRGKVVVLVKRAK
jgi:hypothetical protein